MLLRLRESRAGPYRWRHEDPEFDSRWDEALENAVDVVENSLYQKAVSGDTICIIFYLRPTVRSIAIVNIDIAQVKTEIEERVAQTLIRPLVCLAGISVAQILFAGWIRDAQKVVEALGLSMAEIATPKT